MKKWIAVAGLLGLIVAEAACSSSSGVMLSAAPLYSRSHSGGLTPIVSGGGPIVVSAGTKVEILGERHFPSAVGEFDHIEVDLGNYNILKGWVSAASVESGGNAGTAAATHG
jgi:hypothetical protein